jgi:hypothetical protein
MRKRPVSVIVISYVYLATGAFGLAFHLTGFALHDPAHYDTVLASLLSLLALISGVYMLRGSNWARWLALAWIACHVVLSAFHSRSELVIHTLLCAAFAYFLFSPPAAKYFRSARTRAT